jgi:hypothetical protein
VASRGVERRRALLDVRDGKTRRLPERHPRCLEGGGLGQLEALRAVLYRPDAPDARDERASAPVRDAPPATRPPRRPARTMPVLSSTPHCAYGPQPARATAPVACSLTAHSASLASRAQPHGPFGLQLVQCMQGGARALRDHVRPSALPAAHEQHHSPDRARVLPLSSQGRRRRQHTLYVPRSIRALHSPPCCRVYPRAEFIPIACPPARPHLADVNVEFFYQWGPSDGCHFSCCGTCTNHSGSGCDAASNLNRMRKVMWDKCAPPAPPTLGGAPTRGVRWLTVCAHRRGTSPSRPAATWLA